MQPGYYGPKGEMTIATALIKLFLETNILTFEKSKPQKPIDYLHEVLIPETIIRLIRLISQDYNNQLSLEEAKDIMNSSADFGAYMYSNI